VLSTTCQVSYLFNATATATTTTVMNCCTHNDTDQYVLDRRSILGSVFCFFVNEAPNTRPNAQSIASNPNITAQLRVERIESMVMGCVARRNNNGDDESQAQLTIHCCCTPLLGHNSSSLHSTRMRMRTFTIARVSYRLAMAASEFVAVFDVVGWLWMDCVLIALSPDCITMSASQSLFRRARAQC
jgi:hypothetical protein